MGLAQGKAGHLLNVLLLFTYASEVKWARWHFNHSTFAFPSHCLQLNFTSRYYSSFVKQIPRSIELIEFLFWKTFDLVYINIIYLLHIAP